VIIIPCRAINTKLRYDLNDVPTNVEFCIAKKSLAWLRKACPHEDSPDQIQGIVDRGAVVEAWQ